MGMRIGAKIREARLAEYEHRAGTGHSVVDVRNLVAECRRFRAFLENVADELERHGQQGELVSIMRDAARAPGE